MQRRPLLSFLSPVCLTPIFHHLMYIDGWVITINQLPPLLVPAGQQRSIPRLHWLGVSYGVTNGLLNFWMRYAHPVLRCPHKNAAATAATIAFHFLIFGCWQIRSGFELVYLRQTSNELTAEHTGIMLKVSASPHHTTEQQAQQQQYFLMLCGSCPCFRSSSENSLFCF